MKHYYAGHSYMGTNYTYDSPCWVAYRFDGKADRDEWVNRGESGNVESISQKAAYKIAGIKAGYQPETDRDNRLMAVTR